MGLKLITPPTIDPISLTEAKAHLRVDSSDEDSVIALMIDIATAHVDGPNGFLGRALVDQTWDLVLDTFPTSASATTPFTFGTSGTSRPAIMIPIPPLIAIVSVSYVDTSGNMQVFGATNYLVDSASEPGWVVPVSSTWPATSSNINSVAIRFRAGYINTGTSPVTGFVPADIRGALLLYIGSLYANREEVIVEGRQVPVELPWGADKLLRRRRIDLSMG